MVLKFELGEGVYYPLVNEIIKCTVSEITIRENYIYYKLKCGRSGVGENIFKTFEEARQYCLNDELMKYNEATQKINAWKNV